MNKSKIVNKCRGLIRLPLLLKTHVGGWFLFFRRWFCRHDIVEKVCTKCGKTGFGMPIYKNPPCPPKIEWTNEVTPKYFDSIRKYTIKSPDKYDLEYGITVEIGVMSVEEYFYTKGRYLQLEFCRHAHPSTL
jgi:hypothetical protein